MFWRNCVIWASFTQHPFWARHSQLMVRGPIFYSTVLGIYTANLFRIHCMFLFWATPLITRKGTFICEPLFPYISSFQYPRGRAQAFSTWRTIQYVCVRHFYGFEVKKTKKNDRCFPWNESIESCIPLTSTPSERGMFHKALRTRDIHRFTLYLALGV